MASTAQDAANRKLVVSVKEAAFAAGVSVKAVNQAIDRERIETRPLADRRAAGRRGVGGGEVAYLMVTRVLAPEVRRKIYSRFRGKSLADLPRRLEVGSVILDMDAALDALTHRLGVLAAMHERVEIDPEIRGGDPVFKGTRIPVHSIARKRKLGSTIDELLQDHPALSESDLELAVRYNDLYPRRGRPLEVRERVSKADRPT